MEQKAPQSTPQTGASGPPRWTYAFDEPTELPADELNRLLGGKGANLVVMAGTLRLPVPPGFTIATSACSSYLGGRWPDGLDDELRAQMDRLGEKVGRRFGDARDPLLVSVRSGAPVSMPGMMDTVLNLGLNESTAQGLATVTGDAEFAADCLRRFGEGYSTVIGSTDVPADPWAQLRAAIEAVFRSWNSERAVAYRRRESIADDLGTAVTVQAMVFGNRGPDSATGVLFTRNPSTGEPVPYGDVMFNAQGEDVVAGGLATQPLAALEERLPNVAAELAQDASLLERHYADLCDIEFTVEQGRLWLLQVRVGKRSPRAALRMAIDMAEDAQFPLSREQAVQRVAGLLADPPRQFVRAGDAPAPIARGLPASPGVATGAAVTSSDAAVVAAERGESVILVRTETSPADVPGMARAAGVLTARGGLTSHAAVVARGWGIPAVVGADAVRPLEDGVEIDGQTVAGGEQITIDGSTGEVYLGELHGEWQVAPEAATLLDWARELGIGITTANDSPEPSPAATAAYSEGGWLASEDVLRALAIKGTASVEQLAESLLAPVETVQPLVDEIVADGTAERAAGQLRPSARGKLAAAELFAADRAALGEERIAELLEQFHSLDARMKSIVTAWQMREVGGEQTFNDHSDAEYDAAVLADLTALDGDTGAWLAPLADRMGRFAVYRSRLARALELATGGDQRYVASPRIDSYHSGWFELHEDLIRLGGRKREA